MGKQGPPTSLRFTSGSDLLSWYEHYADRLGVSVNAALLRGLEAHRNSVDGTELDYPERISDDHRQEPAEVTTSRLRTR
jgi:hypothetical protein